MPDPTPRVPPVTCTNEATLTVRVRRPGAGVAVLAVLGEIDLLTAPVLFGALADHIDGAGTLVVDLSEVDFFGAAGLDVLTRVAALATQKGVAMELVPGVLVRRMIALCELGATLHVHDSVAEAVGCR